MPLRLHTVAISASGMSMWATVIVLVDLVGFEPTTSSMPWKRAPNCATGPSLWDVG